MNFSTNNKFINLSLVFFLFVGLTGFSQNHLSEPELQEFKIKVKENAKRTETIVSDFTQSKHLFVLDHVITSKGKLIFKSPNRVRWEYVDPYLNVAIFKDNQLLVDSEGKRQNIDLGSNKMFRSLNSLIVNSIKGDMFDESQFDLTYFKFEDYYMVTFVPKDKRLQKFIASFEMKFSHDFAEVDEVKLIEPNEDHTVITFHDRKVNVPVDDVAFNR